MPGSTGQTLEAVEQRRRQTVDARKALQVKYPTSEARRAHLSRAGRIGNARRRVLSGADVAALAGAFRTLSRIVQKYRVLEATDAQHSSGPS